MTSGHEESGQAANGYAAAWLAPIDRACEAVSALALAAMVVVITSDVVTRNLFGFSMEISNEFGGYLLVAATFLAMPVAQARGAFHHIEFLQDSLSARGRAAVQLVLQAVSLAVVLIIEWQLARFVDIAIHSGDVAPTVTATPLWIPELAMPIGMGLLCVMLAARLVASAQRCHALFRQPPGGADDGL